MAMENYGLIREGVGHAAIQPIPVPRLRDDYILVRTVTIALNPTDWTSLDAVGEDGTIVGVDYAGIVEEVGLAVKKKLKKGDRIAGWSHGGNFTMFLSLLSILVGGKLESLQQLIRGR